MELGPKTPNLNKISSRGFVPFFGFTDHFAG